MKKRGLSSRIMSVLLSLMMLLSLLPTAVLADESATKTYTKVTQAPEDWSGTYLIVSEDSKVALDSSLSKVDAINDYKAVTIENGTIETAENIAVTIAKMADGSYSIQAVNGKYLYQSTDANGLKEGATAMPNTISLNEDGTVDIVSGGAYLRFNYSSNQMRFRYYKSATYASQQPITLYKLGGGLEQVATPTGHRLRRCEGGRHRGLCLRDGGCLLAVQSGRRRLSGLHRPCDHHHLLHHHRQGCEGWHG